jgi:hypothetical protein
MAWLSGVKPCPFDWGLVWPRLGQVGSTRSAPIEGHTLAMVGGTSQTHAEEQLGFQFWG